MVASLHLALQSWTVSPRHRNVRVQVPKSLLNKRKIALIKAARMATAAKTDFRCATKVVKSNALCTNKPLSFQKKLHKIFLFQLVSRHEPSQLDGACLALSNLHRRADQRRRFVQVRRRQAQQFDEHKRCSNSAYIHFRVNDHLSYFNVDVSGYGARGCKDRALA